MALPASTLATILIAGTAITGTAVAVIAKHPATNDQQSQQVEVVDQQPVVPNGKIKVLEPSPLPTQTTTPVPTPTFSNPDDDASDPGTWNNDDSDGDQSWDYGDDSDYEDNGNWNDNDDDGYDHHDRDGDDD